MEVLARIEQDDWACSMTNGRTGTVANSRSSNSQGRKDLND